MLKPTPTLLKVRLLFLIPALALTGLVLYLSLINLSDSSIQTFGMSDKIMHGGAYFGLTLIWMLFAICGYSDKNFVIKVGVTAFFVTIFGIIIEVLQGTLTNYRQLDYFDILANSFGVIAAGLLVWLLKESLIRLKGKINLFFLEK